MKLHVVAHYLDIFIASVFLFSFLSKVNLITVFKSEIFSYKVLPVYLVALAAYSVLILEFAIFIAYSISYPSIIKEFLVLALLVFFTTFLWIKKRRTGSSTCGCFGKAKVLNNNPFLRNFILISVVVLKCFLPFYHATVIESIYTVLGISIIMLLINISLFFGDKKEWAHWKQ
ncbi:hypothetical protein MNQ98_21965 [Paenibacillus sp. N3/727]|uniref:MauE/DoxX family redox-associated membrane protein n=1 Tax=Paenibacillus sp. N3/727 TaxID=2925845 RepID=UPI001F53ACEF|nr:MauE/DoxX family redox-associated membrane protein [Paenibacillus sp. N3/727]UNK17127.1 hypothetical protein MNQ98_21965 [Paenibacillus sp. N3/727]